MVRTDLPENNLPKKSEPKVTKKEIPNPNCSSASGSELNEVNIFFL